MHLRTLGGLSMTNGAFRHPKPLLLLAYLALEGPQPRGRVAALFWPRATDARNRLSVTLTRLRRALPPRVLTAAPEVVRASVATDVEVLRRLLDRGRVDTALRAYRGAFLAELPLADVGEELEEWVFATREGIADQLRAGCLRAATALAADGSFAEAGALAERGWAVAGTGAAEPDVLREAHTLLLAADRPAAAALRREAVGLGVALHGAAAEARAALLAGSTGRPTPNNLRSRGTSFVGRDAERLEIDRLLTEPRRRMVTLVGPGGIGKSRLAAQVAADQVRAGRFDGGVWFVPLEEVRHATGLAPAIATALRAGPTVPADPWERVAAALAERRTLLVLDNVEHLTEAAPEVARLVAICPHLSVLATSREPWAVGDEWVVRVEGLAYPDPSAAHTVEGWAAFELFGDRASQIDPGFTLEVGDAVHVSRIAALTGGSPLALELAATWVTVMTVRDIAAEVARDRDFLTSTRRDADARHRSLRAVFDHSWRLLGAREQGCLAALAVFRGGFDRAGARAVAGATPQVLAALTARSLIVRTGDDRYLRHPLIHQYSEEKLAERPDEEARARTRHAAHLLGVAEAAAAQAGRSEAVAWLERLEADHANLRGALDWAAAMGDDATLLRLSVALVDYWTWRGHHDEATAWFARVAERGVGHDPRAHASALLRFAFLCLSRGDTETPGALIERGLVLARAAADPSLEARAWSHRGMLAVYLGDYAAGRRAYLHALALARAAADDDVLGRVLNNLGDAHAYDGEPTAALEHYRESLAVVRRLGDLQMASNVSGSLGLAALATGDRAAASEALSDSLRAVRRLGIAFSLPTALDQVACLLADEGVDPARDALAARIWGAAEAAREALRLPAPRFHVDQVRPWQERARARLGRARYAEAWAAGRRLPAEVAADLAAADARHPSA